MIFSRIKSLFKVAELVEQEKGMIAGASEVSVVGRSFLVAVCRADAWVHVEDDPRRRATVKVRSRNPIFRFTHRMSHINTPNPSIT